MEKSIAQAVTQRQLVVCCDGTGQGLAGGVGRSNVLRIFEAARNSDSILTIYRPGVGSLGFLPKDSFMTDASQTLKRYSEAAGGKDVLTILCDVYRFLCETYQDGDKIFLFGFSRGAFTVNLVADFVCTFGLLPREYAFLIPSMLDVYLSFDRPELTTLNGRIGARLFKSGRTTRRKSVRYIRDRFFSRDVEIHFIGNWDTVARIGFMGTVRARPIILGSQTRIRHIRHALALDEKRPQFSPLFYELDTKRPLRADQTLKQIWFRGCHSDVGSGNESSLEAQSAFTWMFLEAVGCELNISLWWLEMYLHRVAKAEAEVDFVHDQLYQLPTWALLGMSVRDPSTAVAGNIEAHDVDDDYTNNEETGVQAITTAPRAHRSALSSFPPVGPWSNRRPWGPISVAATVAICFFLLSGYALIGSFTDAVPSRQFSTIAANLYVLQTWQVAAFIHPVEALKNLRELPNVRTALVLDLGLIVAYAYLLARLVSRAFAAVVGWNSLTTSAKWWNYCGYALPTLVVGDAIENFAGIAAVSIYPQMAGHAILWIGAVASVAKIIGLCGVILLALVAWRKSDHLGYSKWWS